MTGSPVATRHAASAAGLLAGETGGQDGPATPAAERLAAWQRRVEMDRDSPFADLEWRAVGPMQSGARVEAIAVPDGRPGTFYVGIGSGNLWKTTNHGITWTPVFEHESAFSIGDVAVAPSDPDVVWVGTGETQPRHSGYSYAGRGVFRSDDGGGSWRHLGLADTHHIGEVLVHPADPDVAWVAALGHFRSRNAERGVFKTADGGATWQRVLHVSDATGAVDLAIDPTDPEVLLAWTWQTAGSDPAVDWLGGPEGGLYRSTDGGETWTPVDAGLPQGPLGRAGLDFAPSAPGVVYLFLDNQAPFEGGEEQENRRIVGAELYRSDDSGATWRKVDDGDLWEVFTVYGWKFTDVRVSPESADDLFILGNRAYRSTDGGATFERVGEHILRLHDTRGEIMHLDHHEIWIDPADPDRVLLGNDGGLFVSYDRGATWLHLNNIPAAEFYSISVDLGDPYRIFGGTQDNAALYGPSDVDITTATVDRWENVYLDRWTGGDSFDTLLDPTDERIVYYEHQHGALRRMDITGGSVLSGGPDSESIRPRAGEAEVRFGWYMPFVISRHDPRTLYAGGSVVLRSDNRGDDWEIVSPELADPGQGQWAPVPFGTITMIAESTFEPGRLWVGTEGGTVWRTDDDGGAWDRVDAGLPERWVSRLVASQHDPDTVYAAFTGYRMDDFSAYLYVSRDGGAAWESLDGDLPDESINAVAEDPTDPGILYVGTDLGVLVTLDGGASWHSLSTRLPTTPVHDIEAHPREPEIVLGTHGRSAFVLDVTPVREAAAR